MESVLFSTKKKLAILHSDEVICRMNLGPKRIPSPMLSSGSHLHSVLHNGEKSQPEYSPQKEEMDEAAYVVKLLQLKSSIDSSQETPVSLLHRASSSLSEILPSALREDPKFFDLIATYCNNDNHSSLDIFACVMGMAFQVLDSILERPSLYATYPLPSFDRFWNASVSRSQRSSALCSPSQEFDFAVKALSNAGFSLARLVSTSTCLDTIRGDKEQTVLWTTLIQSLMKFTCTVFQGDCQHDKYTDTSASSTHFSSATRLTCLHIISTVGGFLCEELPGSGAERIQPGSWRPDFGANLMRLCHYSCCQETEFDLARVSWKILKVLFQPLRKMEAIWSAEDVLRDWTGIVREMFLRTMRHAEEGKGEEGLLKLFRFCLVVLISIVQRSNGEIRIASRGSVVCELLALLFYIRRQFPPFTGNNSIPRQQQETLATQIVPPVESAVIYIFLCPNSSLRSAFQQDFFRIFFPVSSENESGDDGDALEACARLLLFLPLLTVNNSTLCEFEHLRSCISGLELMILSVETSYDSVMIGSKQTGNSPLYWKLLVSGCAFLAKVGGCRDKGPNVSMPSLMVQVVQTLSRLTFHPHFAVRELAGELWAFMQRHGDQSMATHTVHYLHHAVRAVYKLPSQTHPQAHRAMHLAALNQIFRKLWSPGVAAAWEATLHFSETVEGLGEIGRVVQFIPQGYGAEFTQEGRPLAKIHSQCAQIVKPLTQISEKEISSTALDKIPLIPVLQVWKWCMASRISAAIIPTYLRNLAASVVLRVIVAESIGHRLAVDMVELAIDVSAKVFPNFDLRERGQLLFALKKIALHSPSVSVTIMITISKLAPFLESNELLPQFYQTIVAILQHYLSCGQWLLEALALSATTDLLCTCPHDSNLLLTAFGEKEAEIRKTIESGNTAVDHSQVSRSVMEKARSVKKRKRDRELNEHAEFSHKLKSLSRQLEEARNAFPGLPTAQQTAVQASLGESMRGFLALLENVSE